MINKFCGEKKYWDKQVVSPVSMTDGVGKILGASQDYAVNNGVDKLWLQLAFSESNDGCQGNFQFTSGQTDADKMTYCIDRFKKILDGCDTSSKDKKYCGTLTDVCAVYKLKTVSKDAPDPHPLKGTKDLGAFTYKDTDTSALNDPTLGGLDKTCTCWYEALPGQTDVFDRPDDGGKCEDIHETPLELHDSRKQQKREVSTVALLGRRRLGVTTRAWIG